MTLAANAITGSTHKRRVSWAFAAVALTLGVLCLRLIALSLTEFELDFEEAQYWAWSRELALGYFSKPPLIAWLIGFEGAVCGSTEFCVRFMSPVLYAAAGLLVYAAAGRLYNARTGFWAAALFLLAPGVVFSSRLMTTDVPLLACVALALYAFVRLREGAGWGFAVLAGLAVGAGILAKYAMIYVVLGIALAAVLLPQERAWILSRRMGLAIAFAALLVAPNVIWNALHGFVTVEHTGHNISGSGLRVDGLRGLEFLATQFAVFGPVPMAVLLACGIGAKSLRSEPDRLLLVLSIPVVLGLSLYAVVTRANANWAAAAAVPVIVLGAATLVRSDRWALLWASIVLGVVVQLVLVVADANAARITLPNYPGRDPYARVQGWRALAQAVERGVKENGAAAVLTDDRKHAALFTYYLRNAHVPVLIWPQSARPQNHFEISAPLTMQSPQPLLLVSACPDVRPLQSRFAEAKGVGEASAVTGPSSSRALHLFKVAGPIGPVAPMPPCAP